LYVTTLAPVNRKKCKHLIGLNRLQFQAFTEPGSLIDRN